jgi:hypothetical protein
MVSSELLVAVNYVFLTAEVLPHFLKTHDEQNCSWKEQGFTKIDS